MEVQRTRPYRSSIPPEPSRSGRTRTDTRTESHSPFSTQRQIRTTSSPRQTVNCGPGLAGSRESSGGGARQRETGFSSSTRRDSTSWRPSSHASGSGSPRCQPTRPTPKTSSSRLRSWDPSPRTRGPPSPSRIRPTSGWRGTRQPTPRARGLGGVPSSG